MQMCVDKLTIIGSDNDLSPGRRQAIIWTNAGILLIGPLGTNFSEIVIDIQVFSLKKMRLKMSSAKCCPFRLGINMLNKHWRFHRDNARARLWQHKALTKQRISDRPNSSASITHGNGMSSGLRLSATNQWHKSCSYVQISCVNLQTWISNHMPGKVNHVSKWAPGNAWKKV